jgi:hypothetical protein
MSSHKHSVPSATQPERFGGVFKAVHALLFFFWRTLRYRYSLRAFIRGIENPKMSNERILLVLNHAIRERTHFEAIRRQILELAPSVKVEILEYRDVMFLQKAIDFRPQVIMTFPFTAVTIADRFYPIKFLTNCRIITYRAEGGLLDYSGVIVENTFFVGYDRYGPTLVDRELFWGRKMAAYAVPLLLKQDKLSSPDRIGVVGYPEYESYFGSLNDGSPDLPSEIAKRISCYSKERIIFLVTGFHGSLYTKEDIINAKDWYDPLAPDADEKLRWALTEVENIGRFKQYWIEKTLESAKSNPEVLHILKCHPLESLIQEKKKHDPYTSLNGYPNILYVQNVPVRPLLQRCGLFLHYGSTTLAESILLKIPSAFVYSEAIYPRRKDSDFAKLSTMLVDIAELPKVVAEHLRTPARFELTPQMEKALFDVFNINSAHLAGNLLYRPSREIALVLVNSLNEAPQSVEPEDPHLLRSMRQMADFFGLPRQDDKILSVLHIIAQHRSSSPGKIGTPASPSAVV